MIRTSRLTLRRARHDDLTALHSVFSYPLAMRYWSRPEHESVEDTATLLRGLLDPAPDNDDFVVDLQGVAIGKVGAWQLPEVGFILHPPTIGGLAWGTRRWWR